MISTQDMFLTLRAAVGFFCVLKSIRYEKTCLPKGEDVFFCKNRRPKEKIVSFLCTEVVRVQGEIQCDIDRTDSLC